MIRTTLVLLALLAAAPASAQVVYPAGSRIGLVPSAGMAPARGLAGFVDGGTGATVVLVELPAAEYAAVRAGFTDEALKSKGMTVRSRDDVPAGGGTGLLVSGDQSVGSSSAPKTLFLAPLGDVTALAIGQLPPGAPAESEARLRTVLRTVAVRPPLSLDEQVASLPFALPERAGFRPVRAMGGSSILLTDGPEDPPRGPRQPLLIVAQSFAVATPADGRDALARAALLSNTLLKDVVLERAQLFRQGGAEWHEIVARAKDEPTGDDVVVIQTIRFEPGGYLRLVGITRAGDRDEVIPRFRRVADGMTTR